MSRADSWDWLFIIAFVAFALTSFIMDPLAAFHVPLSAASPCPIIRASYSWATMTDPLWLDDPYLMYTCAYWKPGTRTLEEAQANKMDDVIVVLGGLGKPIIRTCLSSFCWRLRLWRSQRSSPIASSQTAGCPGKR